MKMVKAIILILAIVTFGISYIMGMFNFFGADSHISSTEIFFRIFLPFVIALYLCVFVAFKLFAKTKPSKLRSQAKSLMLVVWYGMIIIADIWAVAVFLIRLMDEMASLKYEFSVNTFMWPIEPCLFICLAGLYDAYHKFELCQDLCASLKRKTK